MRPVGGVVAAGRPQGRVWPQRRVPPVVFRCRTPRGSLCAGIALSAIHE